MRNYFLLLLFIPFLINAQNDAKNQISDSLLVSNVYPHTLDGNKITGKQLIVPTMLVALGVYGTIDKTINEKVQKQTVKWRGDTFIDDLLPVAIPASVYVLNWCGVQGRHNFVDRSVIAGTAFILSAGSTFLIKNSIKTLRPDGDGRDAFPSMHTAVAFVGAEFMRQEFKDKSIWYGVAGYAMATTTGFLRIYNNRHWLSDVVTGAGIGILGTQVAYSIYPKIRKIYEGTWLDQTLIVPFGNNQGMGVSFSANF